MAACSVGASTITRTSGSVPLGRSSTRPPSPRSASTARTSAQIGSARVSGKSTIRNGHVAQHLGESVHHGGRQAGQRLAGPDHQVQQEQSGQHPITRGGQIAEDDVAGLLPSEGPPVIVEGFEDVAVPHRGLVHRHPGFGHGEMETQVGHDGDDHRVVGQQAALAHVEGEQAQQPVPIDDPTVPVDCDDPVRVPVEGQPGSGPMGQHGSG